MRFLLELHDNLMMHNLMTLARALMHFNCLISGQRKQGRTTLVATLVSLTWKGSKLATLVVKLPPITPSNTIITHVSCHVSVTNVGTNVEERRSSNVSGKSEHH